MAVQYQVLGDDFPERVNREILAARSRNPFCLSRDALHPDGGRATRGNARYGTVEGARVAVPADVLCGGRHRVAWVGTITSAGSAAGLVDADRVSPMSFIDR